MQATTCSGAIIVEPEQGFPFSFDQEKIVLLSDFWHASDDEIEAGLLGTEVSLPCVNLK